MRWHSLAPGTPAPDVDAFEAAALKQAGVDQSVVPPRYRSSYFLHIWANGYDAGYYAYLWAEMLDNDAFQWFKENGGLTRANGDRFRGMILSRGNVVGLRAALSRLPRQGSEHRVDAEAAGGSSLGSDGVTLHSWSTFNAEAQRRRGVSSLKKGAGLQPCSFSNPRALSHAPSSSVHSPSTGSVSAMPTPCGPLSKMCISAGTPAFRSAR